MNKYKHQLLWFMLPAVLLAGYFVVFQPAPVPEPAAISEQVDEQVDQKIDEQNRTVSNPVGTTTPAEDTTADDVASTESRQQPAADDQQDAEIAEDREFINYAFPLLSSWDLQEVKPLLADATIAASSDEEIKEVMSTLEDRLGALEHFDTPQPVATAAVAPPQAEDGKLQHYQFMAYYEAGQAEVDLVLHKQLNDSSLYSFNIHVPN